MFHTGPWPRLSAEHEWPEAEQAQGPVRREGEVMDFCGRLQRWPQQVRGRVDADSRLGAHTRRQHRCRKQMASGPLKPFDSSCSLRVLSESDKDRPRKSAFPWPWGALVEEGNGGEALVEEVQAPGVGRPHLSHQRCLPPPLLRGARGPAYPPAEVSKRGQAREGEPGPQSQGRARSGDRQGAARGRR